MSQAANVQIPGGIAAMRIADAEDFDAATGNASFVIELTRNQIAKEGFDVPDPEKLTFELADDRMLGMGIDQELSMRFTSMDVTDFEKLEQARIDGTEVFLQFDSLTTNTDGTLKWQYTYKRCILNHVARGGPQVERDTVSLVLVDGKMTGSRQADYMSVAFDVTV